MLCVPISKELMMVPVQFVTINVKNVKTVMNVPFVLKMLTEVLFHNVHVTMDTMIMVSLNVLLVHVNALPVTVKLIV